MKHMTPEQLDEFLSGTPPADAAELRRHLAVCPTCARRLAERARFEEQLEAAAARVTMPRRARGRLALAVAAALVVLLGVGLAMWRPARHAEVAGPPRPSSAPASHSISAPAPVPAMIAASPAPLPASAARLAADAPGLTARIPRLGEDVVPPPEPCGDPSDPTCSAPEVPAPALALP